MVNKRHVTLEAYCAYLCGPAITTLGKPQIEVGSPQTRTMNPLEWPVWWAAVSSHVPVHTQPHATLSRLHSKLREYISVF